MVRSVTASGLTGHFEHKNTVIENKEKRVRTNIGMDDTLIHSSFIYIYILAQTPEIGQGLGRFLSCGARKQEQT